MIPCHDRHDHLIISLYFTSAAWASKFRIQAKAVASLVKQMKVIHIPSVCACINGMQGEIFYIKLPVSFISIPSPESWFSRV